MLTPEQETEQKDRVIKAHTLFISKFNDIVKEVEELYKIRFVLGINKDDPFSIKPDFIPVEMTKYESPI